MWNMLTIDEGYTILKTDFFFCLLIQDSVNTTNTYFHTFFFFVLLNDVRYLLYYGDNINK